MRYSSYLSSGSSQLAQSNEPHSPHRDRPVSSCDRQGALPRMRMERADGQRRSLDAHSPGLEDLGQDSGYLQLAQSNKPSTLHPGGRAEYRQVHAMQGGPQQPSSVRPAPACISQGACRECTGSYGPPSGALQRKGLSASGVICWVCRWSLTFRLEMK